MELLARINTHIKLSHTRKLSYQKVEDASRAKDYFLALLSHEMRNPLSPLLLLTEELLLEQNLSESQREKLIMIRKNVVVEVTNYSVVVCQKI
jgi:signal transduction histidine kinase